MRTIMGKKGLIALSVIVVALAAGVWAWQAGYIPEIGKFFAYEGGVPTPALNFLEPKEAPIGTEVTLHGKNFPAVATIQFGSGRLEPSYVDSTTMRFTVPAELPTFCPPGAYCILSMLPVQPGTYEVTVQADELCVVPTYPPGQEIADAPYDCSSARSNSLKFKVTEGPIASCIPLPRCAYEGEPRCAVDPLPGTVFCPIPSPSCMPRPACLDTRPSCEIAEPADGWCPPTPEESCSDSDGGMDVNVRGVGRGMYVGGGGGTVFGEDPNHDSIRYDDSIAPETIYYDHCYDSENSGQLNEAYCDGNKLSARAIECPSGCSNGICSPPTPTRTPTPPPGCYWQEVQCIRAPCNPVLVCVTPTPTRPPTPTPTSNGQTVSMQLLPTDGFSPVQIGSPRTGDVTVHVNIFMDIPQRTKVTAVDLHVQSDRKLTMSDFHYGSDFPEVLRGPQSTPASYTDNEFSVALGTGPNGGVSGRVLVGTLTVVVAAGDEPELRMFIRDDSTVTAVDSDNDVLGQAGDLWFLTGQRSGLPGDLDGDGDVDIFDYNLVVSNFGKHYSQ